MIILRFVASLKNGFTMLYAIGKIFGADKNKDNIKVCIALNVLHTTIYN